MKRILYIFVIVVILCCLDTGHKIQHLGKQLKNTYYPQLDSITIDTLNNKL